MRHSLALIVLLALVIGAHQPSIKAQGTLPDSVIFRGSQVDVGESFRTGLATGFGHTTINSYFRDRLGVEHLAYIDNYKLYYFRSTDDGEHWSKEQVVTGHEGDIYLCALTADTNGKVFIAITVHDLFNYANPSGITSGGQYFLFDAYCVNNLGGSWETELVAVHEALNAGPKVAGLFVDAGNNVHLVANRYGWYSYGGVAWEWVRNSSTDTWGTVTTIVEFTDAGIDRAIYDTYTIVPDQQGDVTVVMCRMFPPTLTRLFYVRYDGLTWSAPVTITDTVAVAWNRFDAVVDPGGHTFIAYLQNDSSGMPALRVMKDFQPPETASFSLAPGDTLSYFRLHCNSAGLFTMYAWIRNQNVRIAFSTDAVHWTEPIESPDELINYTGGTIVQTDTRAGDFTEYCKQMLAVSGPRAAQPYGPDTLFYGSFRHLVLPSVPDLVTPPPAAVIDADTVEFGWTPALPEVTRYWLEIDTTSGFLVPFIDSTISGTTYRYDQVVDDRSYYWRVRAGNQRGWGEFSDANWFNVVFVPVGDEDLLPASYRLHQNYPNPFNPGTLIRYELPEASHVRLRIHDMLGREVATLTDEMKQPGVHAVSWDASGLTGGVYFLRLTAGSFTQTMKMALIR